jgi:hypothetical protein
VKKPKKSRMADTNPARALDVVRRVEMMCDFIEHPVIRKAVDEGVPVTMPRTPGALGFDATLWVGLGTVGLWAALDGFAERGLLTGNKWVKCEGHCIPEKYRQHAQGDEYTSVEEIEDLRHLYAHNYAGDADVAYAARPRHVVKRGISSSLTSGGHFDGQRVQLDLPHLRAYAQSVRSVLQRFI